MKLLLADDEKELTRALVAVLTHHHYVVDVVHDGEEAIDYLLSEEYDGAILDIMMPKYSGIEVLKKIRKEGKNIPVLMLTAKAEIDDRVIGLDAGADDYLPKPFAMKELLARVRAMMRRKEATLLQTIQFGNVVLNPDTYEMAVGEHTTRLTKKEYLMLEMLFSNPNILISKDRFLDKIWGFDSEVDVNSVWVYISYLRKKLESLDANVRITAARGIGYTLEEQK